MRKIQRKNNKGFALLFSVLLASFLLTIGLSIFSIALKELAISTAARQSVRAFFAADSGRECALYWDVKMGAVPTLVDGEDGEAIKCGTHSETMTAIQPVTSTSKKSVIPGSGNPINIVGDTLSPNFVVSITKSKLNSSSDIVTTIISRGYDSDSDDRVERAIRQTY
jgi:Tfp pilus assembly protein PilX